MPIPREIRPLTWGGATPVQTVAKLSFSDRSSLSELEVARDKLDKVSFQRSLTSELHAGRVGSGACNVEMTLPAKNTYKLNHRKKSVGIDSSHTLPRCVYANAGAGSWEFDEVDCQSNSS